MLFWNQVPEENMKKNYYTYFHEVEEKTSEERDHGAE